MKLSLFNYDLPHELIAQYPTDDRTASNLLVVNRCTGEILDKKFSDLPTFLKAGDLLVLNDSRVIKARLIGIKKETGAKIELFLVKRIASDDKDLWEVLAKPAKRLHPGDIVEFGKVGDDSDSCPLAARIESKTEDGFVHVSFEYEGIFMEVLESLGKIPLPPYIHREAEELDEIRYQTVYSAVPGSAAAPTAGLHFTEEMLEDIKSRGIEIAFVTLHVGLGTFRPVKDDNILEHKMHSEEFFISQKTADMINCAKREGRRVICVGTTSVRTVESAARNNIKDSLLSLKEESGNTDIFIYPGYEFKVVDAMITNFHLPESTLLMLISAFYNREQIIKIYEDAVMKKYRFFSYGDAMLIL